MIDIFLGFVLTAAHCILNERINNIAVVLGDHKRSKHDDGEREVKVKAVYMHGSYDAAIMTLDCQPKLSATIKPIPIIRSSPRIGSYILTAGWGWNNHNSRRASDILQRVHIPVVQSSTCRRERLTVNQHEFCGGYGTGSYKNVCYGDSGGPVIRAINGRFYLMGIVSRGIRHCPEVAHYAVFMKIDYIRSWISRYSTSAVSYCKDESKDKDCFPGESLVQLESSQDVPIKTLVPGDRVLTMSSTGNQVFGTFVGHMHTDLTKYVEYLKIQTSDRTIHVSGNHNIYVSVNNITYFDYAKNIRIGHYVYTPNQKGGFDQSQIKTISRVHIKSLYAPLTSEGTIIVDGVVASCYASVPHTIGHIGMWPYRMWKQYVTNTNTNDIVPYVNMLKNYLLPIINIITY